MEEKILGCGLDKAAAAVTGWSPVIMTGLLTPLDRRPGGACLEGRVRLFATQPNKSIRDEVYGLLWPQLLKCLRQHMLDVFDLALAGVFN